MNEFSTWLGGVAITQYILLILGVLTRVLPFNWADVATGVVFLANSVLAIYAAATRTEPMILPLAVITASFLVGLWLCVGKPRLEAYRARIQEEWMGGHV